MNFSISILLALIVTANCFPVQSRQRREVFVDGNGFFLGGGANNNLREASQLFDLGGPIVNPWLNPWTQPLPRGGFITVPAPIPGGGPVPVPAPEPEQEQQEPVNNVQQYQQDYSNYGQQQQAAPQQQPQAYPQQQVAPPQQQPQAYPQQQVAPPQQQPQAYPQQQTFLAAPPQQQQAYSQQVVAAPQQQLQAYPQQQSFMAAPQQQYAAPAPVQQQFVPSQSYNSHILQSYNPAPAPVQQTFVSQPQGYGSQQQQSGFLLPQPIQQQQRFVAQPVQQQQQQQVLAPRVSAPVPVAVSAGAPASGDNQKPFTAVFIPGEQTRFKLGLPTDYHTNSYTSI
jgi:hypothetical protein